VGWACGIHEREEYGVLVGKPEEKRLLGRHKMEDNITVGGCGLNSSVSRYGPVVDSLVDCNETWIP